MGWEVGWRSQTAVGMKMAECFLQAGLCLYFIAVWFVLFQDFPLH